MGTSRMIAQWSIHNLPKLPQRIVTDIQSALDHGNGERTVDDIAIELIEGTKQLWMYSSEDELLGTVLTEIIQHPQKKVCQITHLGGESMMDIINDIQEIEAWAKLNDCSDIQVIGRRGWIKALQGYGYKERYITIGKQL